MDKRHGWISTKAEGNRNTLKQRMQRNVLERSVEKFFAGYDTVGIRASYQKKYDRRTDFWPAYRLPRAMTVKDVPSRFQELYLSVGVLRIFVTTVSLAGILLRSLPIATSEKRLQRMNITGIIRI